jgi:hypothetical protein
MRITRLSLTNVRCLNPLELRFEDGKMQTILIGRNGTCKTTILRAIAIGLADSKDASGLLAEATGVLVAEGKKTALIEIDVVQDEGLKETFTVKTEIGTDDGQDVLIKKEPQHGLPGNPLVCAYGVGRQTEGAPLVRPYRILDSVYTMFDYDTPLVSTELALRRLRDYLGTRKFPRTLGAMKRALGLGQSDRIHLPKGGGVTVSGPSIGKAIPIEGWADGYRKTLSWILDLYAWGMRAEGVTKSGGIRGILLVDELEQHLHPSMQTSLLSRLSKLFPEVQLVATTHSPLLALGAELESVVVLKRNRGRIRRETSVPDFTMYSVEDMLADPDIFDSMVHRPETNKTLTRYRELAAKSAVSRTTSEKKELKTLADKLSAQQLPQVHESAAAKKLNQLLKKHNL